MPCEIPRTKVSRFRWCGVNYTKVYSVIMTTMTATTMVTMYPLFDMEFLLIHHADLASRRTPSRSPGRRFLANTARKRSSTAGGGVSARCARNQTHYWRKLGWKGRQSHICSTTHAPQPLGACDTRSKATAVGQDQEGKKIAEGDGRANPVIGRSHRARDFFGDSASRSVKIGEPVGHEDTRVDLPLGPFRTRAACPLRGDDGEERS